LPYIDPSHPPPPQQGAANTRRNIGSTKHCKPESISACANLNVYQPNPNNVTAFTQQLQAFLHGNRQLKAQYTNPCRKTELRTKLSVIISKNNHEVLFHQVRFKTSLLAARCSMPPYVHIEYRRRRLTALQYTHVHRFWKQQTLPLPLRTKWSISIGYLQTG
jgi:hypothetical protein